MKHRLSFAAVVISLLFFASGCSCLKLNDSEVCMQANYSLTAYAEYCDEEYILNIRHMGGDYRIIYNQPNTLAGFEEYYTINENGEWDISINYQGLSMDIDNSSLLEASIGNNIVYSLNDAKTKKSREVSGITDEGSYLLKLDSEGYPVELTFPQQNLKVTFKPE